MSCMRSSNYDGDFVDYMRGLDEDYKKVAFGCFLSQDMCNWTRHDDAKALIASYKMSRGGRWDMP